MRVRVMVVALTAVVGWGCSSGGATGGTSTAAPAPSQSRQQDVIGESEINTRASDASNALQVVEKLRPQMLRGRGVASPSDATGATSRPSVFVDDVSYGALESLANVNASSVKEIRFIKAADATTRFGTGYVAGVILVTLKK